MNIGIRCSLLLLTCCIPFLLGAAPSTPLFIDFSQYWCGARLLLEGANPYDAEALFALQQQIVPSLSEPIRQWNPPTIFLFTLPFALLPYQIAQSAWVVCTLLIFGWALATLFSHPEIRRPGSLSELLPMAIGLLLFFPFWETLRFGQVSAVPLLGLLLFVSLIRAPHRGLLAGFALTLSFVKPHLLFLLYFWIIIGPKGRKWRRAIAGMALGGLCLSVAPLILRSTLWQDYLAALLAWPLSFHTPTLGSWLQYLSPDARAIRFIPSLFAGLGLIIIVKRGVLGSPESLPSLALILCASLFLSPYGWSFDQVLLLPTLLLLLRSATWVRWGAVAIQALAFPWTGEVPMQFYFWYPVALGILLLFTLRSSPQRGHA